MLIRVLVICLLFLLCVAVAEVIHSNQEPSGEKKPLNTYIGNGYVGWQINHDALYISGVFNGVAVSERDPSHRARVPSFLNFHILNSTTINVTLDMDRAIYQRISKNAQGSVFLQTWFASRKYRHLLVYDVQILEGTEQQVCIHQQLGSSSRDVTFSRRDITPIAASWLGTTKEAEEPGVPLIKVGIVMTPTRQLAPFGDQYFCKQVLPDRSFTFFATVATSMESSDPEYYSYQLFSQYSELTFQHHLKEHIDAWRQLNRKGIEIQPSEGSSEGKHLSSVINTAQYYILSSIREDWDYSLSPGSVSTNTYNGHVFWDTEIWMYPYLLTFYPQISKGILRYRTQRIKQAEEKARRLKYRGSMFPWERYLLYANISQSFSYFYILLLISHMLFIFVLVHSLELK